MPAPPPARPRPKAPPMRAKASAAVTIEDQIRFAYYTPSPTAYDPSYPHAPDYSEPRRLGKISEAALPSALDHDPNGKAWVPGPGAYCTPDLNTFALPEGGKLSREPPGDRVVLDEYPVPPPGTYGVPNDPSMPRSSLGKFSREPRVSKFIEDEVVRSRSIPGPGAHDVVESASSVKPFCPEGGRTLGADKPPSYFDQAPRQSEGKPAPDRYDMTYGVTQGKPTGKLVYRYESATAQETKNLIAKECLAEGPGPGAYDVPEPAPVSGAPTLKGRSLGHGMPPPFNYNCGADQARNFSAANYAPVRQGNPGEQIYGNSRRRSSTSAGSGARASSDSRSEFVAPQQLPSAFTSGIDIPVEDKLQWRSGGFGISTGGLAKKAKSEADLKRKKNQENPSLTMARQSFPALGRKSGRSAKVFLPMAPRRIDPIPTREGSDALENLRRGRWQLKGLGQCIGEATASALEPLDLEKLRGEAMEHLADKARYRMDLEGISKNKQKAVLDQMYGVMDAEVVQRSNPMAGEASYGEPQEEPLDAESRSLAELRRLSHVTEEALDAESLAELRRSTKGSKDAPPGGHECADGDALTRWHDARGLSRRDGVSAPRFRRGDQVVVNSAAAVSAGVGGAIGTFMSECETEGSSYVRYPFDGTSAKDVPFKSCELVAANEG